MRLTREEIERNIEAVLASVCGAIELSDKLFSPGGLFGQLADTEPERRALTKSPLFQRAQRRLRELQNQEAAEFSRVVRQAQATVGLPDCLVKVERTAVV